VFVCVPVVTNDVTRISIGNCKRLLSLVFVNLWPLIHYASVTTTSLSHLNRTELLI